MNAADNCSDQSLSLSMQLFGKRSSPLYSSRAPPSDPRRTSPNPNYFSPGVTVTALPVRLNPASQAAGRMLPGLRTQGN